MAERNPPSFLQAGSHTGENTRNALAALIAAGGVVAGGDMAVTAPGGTMTVSVAAGAGWVLGSRSYQGVYHVVNDAVKSVTIAASDPTNARYDRIVAEVKDAAYSGATNAFQINVYAGTPSGSPVEPAIPADAFELARITVPAAATTINSGNILDRRLRATSRGQVFQAGLASDVPLVAKGQSGQTADLFQAQDNTGAVKARADSTGRLRATKSTEPRPVRASRR